MNVIAGSQNNTCCIDSIRAGQLYISWYDCSMLPWNLIQLVEAPICQDGWQSIRIIGASACVIFILLHQIQKIANNDMTFGYHPVGCPCMPTQTGGGETIITTLC